MKKILQKNLNKEAQVLMDFQGMLKESDAHNRLLNRQMLHLLQENTRLKIEKVQHNIVAMPPECRKTVQKICSKKIEQYQGRSRNNSKTGLSPQMSQLRISITSNNTPSREKQPHHQTSLKPQQEAQSEPSVFFTFGADTRPPGFADKRSSISSQLQCLQSLKPKQNLQAKYQKRDNSSKNDEPTTPIKSSNKNGSNPKRVRTLHSIPPSPHITPKKDENLLSVTPTKSSKQIEPSLPQEANPVRMANLPQSLQKRKKYIDIISVFLTPSRGGK